MLDTNGGLHALVNWEDQNVGHDVVDKNDMLQSLLNFGDQKCVDDYPGHFWIQKQALRKESQVVLEVYANCEYLEHYV